MNSCDAFASSVLSRKFARFIVVGGCNTLASYAVYLLLLLVIDYRIAYTIAYAAGLASGYWANARFVFRAPLKPRSALAYLASYGLTYLAGVGTLYVAVDLLGGAKALGMLAALLVSVPLSYRLLTRSFSQPAATPSPDA